METTATRKITIPPTSKIRIYWDDKPENYSKESKTLVKNHFAKKYGVDKKNVNVIYRPVKIDNNGNVIEITGANMENIMNVQYQRSLMQEWLKREGRSVDFDRIIKLDDKVNAELNIDVSESNHRIWSVKWIMLNNFLCFGENNYVPFSKLKGLTVVNSVPANQGGKTTLTIDALKFLLYGNTTKTDKNEQVFNTFTKNNDLVVRGMIELDGEELIIERKMHRTPKKGGGWTITNKINYYNLLPDGEEKQQNDEDATKTSIKIKNTIGAEKDFEMLCLATEKNLDELIGLTTTESGKVLTRLIGLEVIEMKESIVRKMYNEFDKKKKSNQYDVITLSTEIEDHQLKIDMSSNIENELINKLTDIKNEISLYNAENDRLLNNKGKIDVTISEMNPTKLEVDIDQLTKKGLGYKNDVSELQVKIDTIGEIKFDEDKYNTFVKEISTYQQSAAVLRNKIKTIQNTIQQLIDGGICQSCNRPLDGVDNTEHIKTHQNSINEEQIKLDTTNELISKIQSEIDSLSEKKKLVDFKVKLELDRDRLEVEMGSLRNIIIAKKNDLKKYQLNIDTINLNRSIDIEVSQVKTKLAVAEFSKDDIFKKIQKIQTEIKTNKEDIDIKANLIQQIKKEDELDKIYKTYIDIVGKKGISKLVLRSVLPIINSEIIRLLDEVCDFEVEIFMDDKNDVQFLINKDGISKLLKSGSGLEKTVSSLALRCVLGKLSTLPMPNFITFDEVLGKVANENLHLLKPLFEKIRDMYDIVFLITHNDLVKDWSTSVITVVKENNISKVGLQY